MFAHCVMQVCGGNAGALKQAAAYSVSLGGWQPGKCGALKGSYMGVCIVFTCDSINNSLACNYVCIMLSRSVHHAVKQHCSYHVALFDQTKNKVHGVLAP
jgi:hypothetical protein